MEEKKVMDSLNRNMLRDLQVRLCVCASAAGVAL